jgi:hypothetical protein
MEGMLWVLLPGFVAVASGLLCWFIMQSRMDVKLAQQRELLAEERGSLSAERASVRASLESSIKAAELKVEQRHYTRENRMLMGSRKSLVLQERMYFRNLPLSDWIEHEIVMDDNTDVNRLVQDMTVFDKGVVSIAEYSRQKQLA